MDFSSLLFPCPLNSISHILKCSKTRTYCKISVSTGPDQKNPSDVSTLAANWNILRCLFHIFPGIHARNMILKTKYDPRKASKMTKTILVKNCHSFIENLLYINPLNLLTQSDYAILFFLSSFSNSSSKNKLLTL